MTPTWPMIATSLLEPYNLQVYLFLSFVVFGPMNPQKLVCCAKSWMFAHADTGEEYKNDEPLVSNNSPTVKDQLFQIKGSAPSEDDDVDTINEDEMKSGNTRGMR